MQLAQSYVEMLNRAYNKAGGEGSRPYPVPAMEIFLLDHAERKARRKEAAIFEQLTDIFDWKLTRKQRNDYLKALNTGFTLVLTDLTRSILWTSHSFLAMTGYTPAEVIGRSPAMLQGSQTDPQVVRQIRDKLNRANPVATEVLNYRKNGEPYLCRIAIDPLRNGQGELTHFLAVECESQCST